MRYYAGDTTIGRSLELYGEWAQAEVHLLEQIVRAGDTVIDVGANIGTHALAFAQMVGRHGRVHAFEPSSWNYDLLTANLAANNLTSVRSYQSCVGAAPGTVAFPLIGPLDGDNLGAVGFYLIEEWGCETVERPITSIDSLALPRIDLIKIDVEGHELAVLDGAMATIAAARPAIFVEIINAVAVKSGEEGFAQAVIERLRPLGYHFWHYPTPLFNPSNWRGNDQNIFTDIWSFDMLCVPSDRFVVVGLSDAEKASRYETYPDRWRSSAVIRIG